MAVSIQHPVEAEPVPVVADGSIATVAVGDMRMIPLLILDTSKRPDIEDMVKAHHHMGSISLDLKYFFNSYSQEL